jgi:hypothetical protein
MVAESRLYNPEEDEHGSSPPRRLKFMDRSPDVHPLSVLSFTLLRSVVDISGPAMAAVAPYFPGGPG